MMMVMIMKIIIIIVVIIVITNNSNNNKQPICDFCAGFTTVNDTVYDFSVDHSAIEKEDILTIHKYLMKNNI